MTTFSGFYSIWCMDIKTTVWLWQANHSLSQSMLLKPHFVIRGCSNGNSCHSLWWDSQFDWLAGDPFFLKFFISTLNYSLCYPRSFPRQQICAPFGASKQTPKLAALSFYLTAPGTDELSYVSNHSTVDPEKCKCNLFQKPISSSMWTKEAISLLRNI